MNHIEQAKLQLSRKPKTPPRLLLNRAHLVFPPNQQPDLFKKYLPDLLDKPISVEDFQMEDFHLTGYDPYPHIKAPVAV